MSPRLPLLVPLLLLLPCAAAGADPGASDSSSVPAGAAAVALHHPLEGLVRADRVAHVSLGLALGVGVGLASREPAAGAGTALALAVAKELLDDRFDRGDLAAGAVGAGLAWLIVAALTR